MFFGVYELLKYKRMTAYAMGVTTDDNVSGRPC